MNEHMEAAIEAGAREVSRIEPNLYKIPHAPNRYYSSLATEIITAALPHIRAMIAEETANSWIPHRDELAQAIASGYEPDHPVPNRHDYKATDSVLRLLTAAQIAEGNRP